MGGYFCWCMFWLFTCWHASVCVLVHACVCVCVCVYLGGLGMLPPMLDSQTVRVPNSYGRAPVLKLPYLCLCVCVRERRERVCVFICSSHRSQPQLAVWTGIKWEGVEESWKRDEHKQQHACLYTDFFLFWNVLFIRHIYSFKDVYESTFKGFEYTRLLQLT